MYCITGYYEFHGGKLYNILVIQDSKTIYGDINNNMSLNVLGPSDLSKLTLNVVHKQLNLKHLMTFLAHHCHTSLYTLSNIPGSMACYI